MIKYVLIVITLDVVSGVLKSIIKKRTLSKSFYDGILKKFSLLVMIALSFIIDEVVAGAGAVYVMVQTFIIACESLSILENVGECGAPIPGKLKDVLEVLKNESK